MGWDDIQYPSDWDARRKRVYKRDGYKCQKCGKRGGKWGNAQLHAHHIDGRSHNLSNLTTLCHSCHEKAHGHPIPTNGGSRKGSGINWTRFGIHNIDTEDVDHEEAEIFPAEHPVSRLIGFTVWGMIFFSPILFGIFTHFFAGLILWIILLVFLGKPLLVVSEAFGSVAVMISDSVLTTGSSENPPPSTGDNTGEESVKKVDHEGEVSTDLGADMDELLEEI